MPYLVNWQIAAEGESKYAVLNCEQSHYTHFIRSNFNFIFENEFVKENKVLVSQLKTSI